MGHGDHDHDHDHEQSDRWQASLRKGVTPVQVDDELLLLDHRSSSLVRLDGDAARALAGGDPSIGAALDTLGLTATPDRRQVLGAAAIGALGISVLALPTATSAASPGIGGDTGPVATFSDGTLDPDFDANVQALGSATVYAVAVQDDGRIVIGGYFTGVGGVTRKHIARLEANGALDMGFDVDVEDTVYALAIQDDDSIVIGGAFRTVEGEPRDHLARVDVNGVLDEDLDLEVSDEVYALAIQPGGSIVLGGAFANINEEDRFGLARVHPNGSLDMSFDPDLGDADDWVEVSALAVQTDGSIILGGEFVSVSGTTRTNVARLHANGALDAGFDPNVDNLVHAIAIHSNGSILLGGDFFTVGGAQREHLARLHANGALDTTFDADVDDGVRAIAIQTDGSVVFGGDFFETVGGEDRNRIARVDADGTVDPDFDPDADDSVLALGIQADGGIIVGGEFATIGGQSRTALARLVRAGA